MNPHGYGVLGGKYTEDEIKRILEINGNSRSLLKPYLPFYKKSATEHGPSNYEKKEFVHYLINESTMDNQSKKYLIRCEDWVPKYQMKGVKYGIVSSAMVFFFMPVVRKQTFVRRAGISLLPMVFFVRWGYIWGHEYYWRRAKEVVVNYEMAIGTRSKFTMK